MFFLFILSFTILFASNIKIHEINKIENITLRNGSSITQGGVTIIRGKSIDKKHKEEDNNSSISQGIITIDENITSDVHYDIVNIIDGYPIEIKED